MASKRQEQEAMRAVGQTGMDPAVMAAGASVLLSWYEYFVQGNRAAGLFIGLWPPTFLAFASYFKQTRMSDTLDHAMGRSGLMDSIERMMQAK